MLAVSAVAVGVVTAHEFGIAATQAAPVDVEPQPHGFERLGFLAAEAAVHRHFGFAARAALDPAGARGNRVERVGEIGPARHAVHPGGGAKARAFGAPARTRRLRGEDFLGAHALEPVIAGIEFAHMVETQPAPFGGPVETVALPAGRAKFARLVAGGMGADPARARMLSVKLCLAHSF